MKRSYTRKDVQDLLSALDRQAKDAARLARQAEEDVAKDSFLAYNDFRSKVGEFRALCILVESRMKAVAGDPVHDLQEQYMVLDTQMLGLLVKASMRFFFMLSAKTTLPLGAREIFLTELRSLHEAAEKLRRPEFETRLDAGLRKELETAELILEEIIHKAPAMLSFA